MNRSSARLLPGRLLPLCLGLAVGAALLPSGVAAACGAFFPRVATVNVPSLSAEQVLVIHDGAKGMEHFVREVAFEDGDQSFGFVVPVPSRPEVVSVKKRPFAALDRDYPMRIEPPGSSGGRGIGMGEGSKGGVGNGVTVLEVKQVGSFTAFVLAATDAGGLRKWLDENRLTTTKESESWLEVYVKQSFFFVAMRHDPPTGAPAKKKSKKRSTTVTAETIRLSFATPVPFYPYREPEHPTATKERVVALWVVTDGPPRVPVALREHDGQAELARPFHEGESAYSPDRALLGVTVGDELAGLLPTAALTLQVFEDQKLSRRGYGDVLFVPRAPVEKPIADAGRMATILDPAARVAR